MWLWFKSRKKREKRSMQVYQVTFSIQKLKLYSVINQSLWTLEQSWKVYFKVRNIYIYIYVYKERERETLFSVFSITLERSKLFTVTPSQGLFQCSSSFWVLVTCFSSSSSSCSYELWWLLWNLVVFICGWLSLFVINEQNQEKEWGWGGWWWVWNLR